MPNATEQVSIEVMLDFAEAWNRHDVDALMSFMTEDCAFEASAGPEVCGARYVGRDAVRAAFAEVWATFPDAHWGDARHFVAGERGCRSGRSPERARTLRASRFTVAMCSPFAGGRSRSRTRTARIARRSANCGPEISSGACRAMLTKHSTATGQQ